MTYPQTGWIEMVDPATRPQGRPLRLAVADDEDGRTVLYAHEDRYEAACHPVDLTGDLHEAWVVLRGLEDALRRHPITEREDELAKFHQQAVDAVNAAQKAVGRAWAGQTTWWDFDDPPASGPDSPENDESEPPGKSGTAAAGAGATGGR